MAIYYRYQGRPDFATLLEAVQAPGGGAAWGCIRLRIAAFGDVHGNLTALEAVLDDIARQRADAVVCMGDLAFRGPQPAECLARIRASGVPCVYGNTDQTLLSVAAGEWWARVPAACRAPEASLPWVRWHTERLSAADLDYLAGLPFEHRVEADRGSVLFVHATPQDCTAAIQPGDGGEALEARLAGLGAEWLVMGHIHRAFAFRHGAVQLVNTGAVGFSLDRDWRASYALVDTAGGGIELRRVAYDLGRAVEAARAAGFCFPPREYEEALRTGYWPAVPWEARRWGGEGLGE